MTELDKLKKIAAEGLGPMPKHTLDSDAAYAALMEAFRLEILAQTKHIEGDFSMGTNEIIDTAMKTGVGLFIEAVRLRERGNYQESPATRRVIRSLMAKNFMEQVADQVMAVINGAYDDQF